MDVYFRRDYAEVSAALERGEAAVLETADGLFPVIVREAAGVRDVTNPYGYGGALARDADTAARFYEWYGAWCAENGVIASFVRFHPLLENHRYAEPVFRLEQVAGSVSWRLEGDLAGGMHAHHRRAVRRAEREGIDVEVTCAPDALDGFASLYAETMRRQEAARFYFFPAAYWEGLAARDWVLRLEARRGGELLAAILCLDAPPWLHYHLGASAEAARGTGANHLLMLRAAEWAQARGYEQFHLGAGVGGSGSALLEYKRRFYPHELREQWIGKAVHDPARYRELTGRGGPHDGFFPAYRHA